MSAHTVREIDPDMEVDVEVLDVTGEETRKLLPSRISSLSSRTMMRQPESEQI